MSFSQSLAIGQIGESMIARWLNAQNYHVLPVYEKELGSGKGPRFFSNVGELIAPDMQVLNDKGQYVWLEAKMKTCFSFHGSTGRFVTGVNKKHYDDYVLVQNLTRCTVYLFFWHPIGKTRTADVNKWNAPPECPTGLFYCPVNTPCNHVMVDLEGVEMIYWAHESLIHMATVEQMRPHLAK